PYSFYICPMFFKNLPGLSVLALQVMMLASCAAPKAPTGGPKDETPPAIIWEESTPNKQTFFKDKKVTITFDEWITLKDVNNQLVISPFLPESPEVTMKGKSIIINLPDSLKEETTYTFNFGNAIADLNEGNILENFSFSFSTGAVLDSSKVSGNVIDVVTMKPVENIWVMLYPVGEDSAVYKRKPDYVAKTNKEGKWFMENIRPDSFNVVALKDDNLNFLYDQETELFGWQDEIVYTAEPYSVVPEILVFPKEKRTLIRDVSHPMPGWINVVVDAPFPKPEPIFSPAIEGAVKAWSGDTLKIWYNPQNNYAGDVILNNDTSQVRLSPGAVRNALPFRISPLTGRLHSSASAQFISSVPIVTLDTSKITLGNDSLGRINYMISIDSNDVRKLNVKGGWNKPARYTLTFLPGATMDVWGRTNDTIRQYIVVLPNDQFGNIKLTIDGLDSTKQYLVLIKNGELVAERFTIQNLKSKQLQIGSLLPATYSVEIIEDLNGNNTWDTGVYETHRQPERKMIFKLDALRASWDLEATISWF
ncbi:MAG: Ig-like domain-containing protein, partial [Saprospiraceae bacterium]|nr:Ig-like domain-containing protein [Saprospiraceae bacterium]